ncbi:hypothetical protein [Konateibacter massiliensis]|uniref:hypothetical protein n=1 Tax=Konateibacter massiliensis TaxID=2002841 RepID=UPI000C1532BC|nr:hypothetical protein [Konateibacter massiliensis]
MTDNDLNDLAIQTMSSLIEYYGNSDSRSIDCKRAKNLLIKNSLKIYKGNYTCPSCSTFNSVWESREHTVKNDVVYCWHCGQKVQLK